MRARSASLLFFAAFFVSFGYTGLGCGRRPPQARHELDSLNLDQIRTQLTTHYHTDGPGRTPINPLAMLKAQLAKHLLNIISDRRLALRLRTRPQE